MTAPYEPLARAVSQYGEPQAISFDLDDTLWPIWPTIARAEQVVWTWLIEHAPATAERFDRHGLRQLRQVVAERHPEWQHDLSRMRLESLREALRTAGDDPGLAEPAFDVFFEARQQVELFPDALDALQRLAKRYTLVAVTNGNSDLNKVGLGELFATSVSASQFGVAKPDPRIFLEACRRIGVPPSKVWHVGDDLQLDVQAALAAGLPAVWVHRGTDAPEPQAVPPEHVPVVAELGILATALGC